MSDISFSKIPVFASRSCFFLSDHNLMLSEQRAAVNSYSKIFCGILRFEMLGHFVSTVLPIIVVFRFCHPAVLVPTMTVCVCVCVCVRVQKAGLSCYGVGPVLMVSPKRLDWGTIPVLCYDQRQVTLTNESEIDAHFTAFLVTTRLSDCR